MHISQTPFYSLLFHLPFQLKAASWLGSSQVSSKSRDNIQKGESKRRVSLLQQFEPSSVTSDLYWESIPTNPKSILQICCLLRYLRNKPSPRPTWLQGNFKWYSGELVACFQFSPAIPELRALESPYCLKTVDPTLKHTCQHCRRGFDYINTCPAGTPPEEPLAYSSSQYSQ